MNPNSFQRLIKILQSCRTQDQYISFCDWMVELRGLYNFSGKQSAELNDEYLKIGSRIGSIGYEQIYYEDSDRFIDHKYRYIAIPNK